MSVLLNKTDDVEKSKEVDEGKSINVTGFEGTVIFEAGIKKMADLDDLRKGDQTGYYAPYMEDKQSKRPRDRMITFGPEGEETSKAPKIGTVVPNERLLDTGRLYTVARRKED